MEILHWTIVAALLGLSTWIAILNAGILWKNLRGEVNTPSSIPLLGGILGVIGLWIFPSGGGRSWAWLPLVLDYGSLPLLLLTAVYYWKLRGSDDTEQ